MDCIDCHNRAAHTFVTAEDALNRAMAEGGVSPDLPWVHKEGLQLLKAKYALKLRRALRFPFSLLPFIAPSIPRSWPQRPRWSSRRATNS